MKDLSQKEQFVELRARGKSFSTIATELDVSKNTLISWAKEFQEDIANQKQLELDTLREQYKITKQHRLKLYSKQLETITDEVEKRGLTDVPTVKLIEMQIKLADILRAEEGVPVFSKTEMGVEDFNFTYTESWTARRYY